MAAGAAEDGATGEHLGAERDGLAVAAQAGGTLELGEQIEQHQDRAEARRPSEPEVVPRGTEWPQQATRWRFVGFSV